MLVLTFGLSATTALSAPFTFLVIDSETERLYGSIPLDRALLAKAINRLNEANAKGIVIKFFFDLPRNEASDQLLEESLCHSNVALQACFNEKEGTTAALDNRFIVAIKPPEHCLSGKTGLIPLERFSKCARSIGFVEVDSDSSVPLMESYQGNTVKSLSLCALEMATGRTATFSQPGEIRLGNRKLSINDRGMHSINLQTTNRLIVLPFHQVLEKSPLEWSSSVSGSVVILGYDGEHIHSIPTKAGSLKAHQFFVHSLLSLYNEMGF